MLPNKTFLPYRMRLWRSAHHMERWMNQTRWVMQPLVPSEKNKSYLFQPHKAAVKHQLAGLYLTLVSAIPPSGQREDEAFSCSSLYLPQSLQSQRRSSSIRQLHFSPLQLLLQLHAPLSFISPDPGLPALLGLCPLPRPAQRRACASRPASCLGPEPAWNGSVCGQHGNGPFGVDETEHAGAAAARGDRH